MPKVKYISVKEKDRLHLSDFPNFSATGNVWGMKHHYYGEDALLVRSGAWIYNVTSRPEIYYTEAH